MAVFFTLLALIAQVAFLAVTRTTVAASVDGSVRRASIPSSDIGREIDRLDGELRRGVPGADVIARTIERAGGVVTVRVVFRWIPPGPDLVPLTMTIERSANVAVPP